MTERVSFTSLDTARLTRLRLGAFVLDERLGVGGMSEVWRATHVASGAMVAVKLLATRSLAGPTWERSVEALRLEILLLARLDHPGILRVLEFGTVTHAESQATEGALSAGSPYLVTPWARSGSLDRAGAPPDWNALQATLSALLGALAHAHARGVVHRDLKPANVLLLGDPAEGPPRPVLSDFGIAFALARVKEGPEDQLGTPSYMAPEQVLGPPLEQGPTTDLYALGCLAYRLATGHAPFTGSADDVLRSHVLVPPPPLHPIFAVPEGFAEWTQILLAKQPHQRFPSAAAARRALASLGTARWLEPPSGPHVVPASSSADAMTAPQGPRGVAEPTRSSAPPAGPRPSSPDGRRARLSLFPTAPPPRTWRTGEPRTTAVPPRPSAPPRPSLPDFDLVGAGLGLFGLRRLEVAGRERERDELYAALLEVHDTHRPFAVVVRGANGLGTTRLGEWLLETASELDVGVPQRLGVADVGADPLVELVRRLVGTQLLAPALAEARARAWARDAALTPSETQDLLALLGGDDGRFAYPSERLAAVRRMLGRGASRVPLVLLLDDAVLARECVELVAGALESGDPLPVLFVVTASDDQLDPSEPAGELRARELARITGHERAKEIRLGPLTPDEQASLVERLLGLEPGLGQEVVERTEGSPLFAVQLVGDWVSRGLLAPTPRGFVLKPGARAEVPDGIHALFLRRLGEAAQAIAARSSEADAEQALIGLELAAVLSPAPLAAEWHAVLDAARIPAAHALPELAVRGLVRTRRERFTIAHRMLRESLLRRAREGGRERQHHRVIAEVLAARGADPSRIAAHRLGAGLDAEALEPLLRSAELRCARGENGSALEAMRLYDEALGRLGVAADDERRTRGLLLRAEIAGHLSMVDEAVRAIESIRLARATPAVLARLAWLRGIVAQKRGEAARGIAHFEQALTTVWSASGMSPEDREIEPRALYGVAECAKLLGDLDRAEDAYLAVQARIDQSHRLAPLVLTGLTDLAARRSDVARALVLGHQALELLEARGARLDAAIARNALGDIERRRGQLREAEHHYRVAFSLLGELGSNEAEVVRLNLAIVATAQGDFERAALELDAAERRFVTEGRTAYRGFAALIRLPSLASRRDEAGVRAVLEAQATFLERIVDPDVAWCLERAHALGAGWMPEDLAAELERRARSQRARLS